jgi:retinol dehydrogenase 12
MIFTLAATTFSPQCRQALLAKNATVYIASRSKEKGNSAVTELKTATGNNNAHFLQVDLADLPSIQRAFAEFQG